MREFETDTRDPRNDRNDEGPLDKHEKCQHCGGTALLEPDAVNKLPWCGHCRIESMLEEIAANFRGIQDEIKKITNPSRQGITVILK